MFEILNVFSCPCVIISGNEDPNYKLETVIKSGEFCENPSFRVIEGAGHFPHQSHWADVNQVLQKILVGSVKTDEDQNENSSANRGIVGRMINKMYEVGNLSALSSDLNPFSVLTT